MPLIVSVFAYNTPVQLLDLAMLSYIDIILLPTFETLKQIQEYILQLFASVKLQLPEPELWLNFCLIQTIVKQNFF